MSMREGSNGPGGVCEKVEQRLIVLLRGMQHAFWCHLEK